MVTEYSLLAKNYTLFPSKIPQGNILPLIHIFLLRIKSKAYIRSKSMNDLLKIYFSYVKQNKVRKLDCIIITKPIVLYTYVGIYAREIVRNDEPFFSRSIAW